MFQPLPHISLQTDTPFERTVLFHPGSGQLLPIENSLRGISALEGCFRSLPRNHKDGSMDIYAWQIVKEEKVLDEFVVKINNLSPIWK